MNVYVLGNDHTNTLGVVQSLGVEGIRPICCLWGNKTGIIKASRYPSRLLTAKSSQACIEKIVSEYDEVGGLIIPCCDEASYRLEQNKRILNNFNYESVTNRSFSMEWLLKKNNQVILAKESGFNVPLSMVISRIEDIPKEFVYPCLVKPLVSMEGGKAWTRVCENESQLLSLCSEALKSVTSLLLQEFIQKNYDYVVLGCGLKDGSCVIPGLIKKHKLFPKDVGLETVVTIDSSIGTEMEKSIRNYIKTIGLIGLFSIEFVQTKDGRFYFVEINPRNDGVNQIVTKSGVNLPFIHYCDVLGNPIRIDRIKKTQMIWEIHHFMSLVKRDTSLSEWIKDVVHSDCWMVYSRKDWKPFFIQFAKIFAESLHLIRHQSYM